MRSSPTVYGTNFGKNVLPKAPRSRPKAQKKIAKRRSEWCFVPDSSCTGTHSRRSWVVCLGHTLQQRESSHLGSIAPMVAVTFSRVRCRQ